jgi:glycosyl hydrolase family 39 (putative alpha-L-iduronidase)
VLLFQASPPQTSFQLNVLQRSIFRACCFLVFLLAWQPASSEQNVAAPTRELPLNHFARAGLAPDPSGFSLMATAIGDDYFDGTSPVSRLVRHFKAARRAGVKYLRCAFSWNGIEPEPGNFQWKFWDTLVRLAEENHIGLIPYVAYTPQWAARDSKDFWKQPPRDPKLYADFMYRITERYRGRVASWEIWNEPDNKDYWLGSADEFAELVRLAARSIRQADPHAVLVLGGMANGPSEFFESLITHHHLDRTVDVIAMHAYPESWLNAPAETIFQQWLPRMRELVAQDQSGDAVWVNEMGYPDYRYRANQASVYGTNIYYSYEHTRSYQAKMLFKMEVMALASRHVSLTGVYRIDDFPKSETRLGGDLVNYHLGVLDVQGHAKPALFALAFFNRLFGEPVRVLSTRVVVESVHAASNDRTPAGPKQSESVLNVFQTKQGKIIVVGWLRGPLAGEVPAKTGMLEDQRSETLSAELPCAGARVIGFYDAQGNPVKHNAHAGQGWLRNIRLFGGRLFLAELGCGGTRPNPK